MSAPFSPARVSRFLGLCFLAMFVFWLLYFLLTHASARESVKPQGASFQLAAPSSSGTDA